MTQEQPEQNQVPPSTTAAGEEEQGEQLVLTSPEEAQTPKDFALWAGVILLAALTVYSPALRGDFLWDDDRHVSSNRNLRDFNGLVSIWTKLGIPRGGTVQYYPLTHTTFWLEYQLTGAEPGQISTIVFHVTNVVLHVIAAVLLWLVLRELKVPGSWVAAAVWALHPIQVESVAWISERKNVLAGVFFFGSILAYLLSGFGLERRDDPRQEAVRGPAHPGLYWLSLGLFVCALLSKSVSCSMPAVVLLLIWWKRGRLTVIDFAATAPFFVLGIGMAALTAYMERYEVGARGPEWEAITFPQRILIAGKAIWFYVEKNLWPGRLTFIYPRWKIAAAPATWWFFPAGVVAVMAILFALRRRIGRGPVVAWLIFCGVLFPALGFFDFYPMRYAFVADHFQYLAGPALIALIVAAVTVVMRRVAANATAAPYVLAGIVLVVLSALTLMQARVYAGPLALWMDTVSKNPDSWMPRSNLAHELLRQSDFLEPEAAAAALDESMTHFQRTVELLPVHDRAWNGWGQALLLRGRFDEALEKFDKSIALNPRNVDALMGRGRLFFETGRLGDALAAFGRALAAAESLKGTGAVQRLEVATIHQYLGKIADAKNDLETAAKHYAEAVRIVGDASLIRYEYGHVLARQAKLLDSPATTQVASTQAATTQPTTTRPATQPSEQTKKLLAAAAQQCATAIELRPDFVDARIALANLMIDVGNLRGAQTQLDTALRTLSADPAMRNQPYPPLVEAINRWDKEMRQRETATTGPATTRAAATTTTATPVR